MDILSLLETYSCVIAYDVQVYQRWADGFYVKIKLRLSDGSELHAREYIDANERNYAFHWQTADKQLISRWDNAPHHRTITTFPHHRHKPEGIVESSDITLDSVLNLIQKQVGGER